MHNLSSSFVLGYHGCDRAVAEDILAGAPFVPSENDYDWLGHGIYFWETNPKRGLEWAQYLQKRDAGKKNQISEPYVIGAVIDLGYCLDLLSSNGIAAVKASFYDFKAYVERSNISLPQNSGGQDLLLRRLDCAVINHLHHVNKVTNRPAFDTVRAVFIEGERIYDNSGFREKSHLQICVCNPGMIKGVFRVSNADLL